MHSIILILAIFFGLIDARGCPSKVIRRPTIKSDCNWKDAPYFVQRVLSQHGESICAGCAATHALEFIYSQKQNQAIETPAQWTIDCVGRQVLDNILNTFTKKREELCVREACYPHQYNGVKQECQPLIDPETLKCKFEKYKGPSIEKLIDLLKAGPILVIVNVPQELRDYKTDKSLSLQYFTPDKYATGPRHAFFVIGFRVVRDWFRWWKTETHFYVKSSWGTEFGYEGYAWLNINDPTIINFNKEVFQLELDLKPEHDEL